MEVSIIIPTHNEEKDIFECLGSLKNQTFKDFEVIIVDDGSTDNTISIINKFKEDNKKQKLRILKQNHQGPGPARNLGAKKAWGKIFIFVDSDMTFDKSYIKNLIEPIIKDKTKKIVGTTHELEVVKNITNMWSRCWGRIRVSKEDANKVNVFRAIKKNKFVEMGGFDPKYGYADDQTFWFKFKIKPVVAKDTICYHKNPETLKGVYKQSRWIGSSSSFFLLNLPIINYLFILLLYLLSILFITILSIKKSAKNKDFKVLFPWMFIFIAARYFGTLSGYFKKVYFNVNYR